MERQSLIQYILIGLAFVLVFIGVAYLAYRFSTRPRTVVTTSPTPTVTLVPPPVGTYPRTVVPAPVLPPPVVYQSPPKAKPIISPRPMLTSSGQSVAQDGLGNLLINNLTHEEHFLLEREMIRRDAELKLAQERMRLEFEKRRLVRDTRADELTNDLAKDKLRYQFLGNQQLVATESRLTSETLQARLTQDRLRAQIELEKNRLKGQLTSDDQTRLLEAQSRLRLIESQQQALSQKLLLDSQADSQIRLSDIRAKQQVDLQDKQLTFDRYRIDSTLSQRQNDQFFAKAIATLRSQLGLEESAIRHRQTLELLNQQASLRPYSYASYPSYGYPSYGYTPYQGSYNLCTLDHPCY